MNPALADVESKLEILIAALDAHDAADIMRATEALSQAVLILAKTHFPAGTEEYAQQLIGKVLGQLEAAAIRINVLRAWTRQRIDRNNQFRGIRHRGMQLSY